MWKKSRLGKGQTQKKSLNEKPPWKKERTREGKICGKGGGGGDRGEGLGGDERVKRPCGQRHKMLNMTRVSIRENPKKRKKKKRKKTQFRWSGEWR